MAPGHGTRLSLGPACSQAIPSAVAWSPVSSTPFRSHRLIVSPLERVEATRSNLYCDRVGMGDVRTHAQLRASCGMLWCAWSDGVVPLRVELVALDIEARHLLVANLDPLRIAPRVQHAVHCQPARRRSRGNQIHDGRMADERAASPSLGDVAEQAMLDLVPLRGSGWIVADRDR